MAQTRTQRLKEKKKYYRPVPKSVVICEGCHDEFKTSRGNQAYCPKTECQRKRKLENMKDYIRRESKKLENERLTD